MESDIGDFIVNYGGVGVIAVDHAAQADSSVINQRTGYFDGVRQRVMVIMFCFTAQQKTPDMQGKADAEFL